MRKFNSQHVILRNILAMGRYGRRFCQNLSLLPHMSKGDDEWTDHDTLSADEVNVDFIKYENRVYGSSSESYSSAGSVNSPIRGKGKDMVTQEEGDESNEADDTSDLSEEQSNEEMVTQEAGDESNEDKDNEKEEMEVDNQ